MADEKINHDKEDQNKIQLLKKHFYQRNLSEINESELGEIEKLEEGWFVEFKSVLPDASKIARSISSFANSHGGLVVIGVIENQKTRRFGSYQFMTKSQTVDCIEQVRNASIAHLIPSPFYEIQEFKHPTCEEGRENCWLVLLRIPRGKSGPYLHSNGCVYVRVGDSASPIALSDLGQMERIWSESSKRKNELKNRIEFLSEQNLNSLPSLQFVITSEEAPSDENYNASFYLFKKHALSSSGYSTKPLFNQIQTLDRSYVARLANEIGGPASIVWDFDRSRGLHFIHLPIAAHFWNGHDYEKPDDFAFDGLKKLRGILSQGNQKQYLVCDLLPSLYLLSVLLYKIKAFHKDSNIGATLRLNLKAVDVKNTIPYLDTNRYFSEAELIGLPHIFRELDFICPLDQMNTWIELSEFQESPEGLNAIDLTNTFAVFIMAGISLGISSYISAGIDKNMPDTLELGELVKKFSILASTSFSWTTRSNPEAKKR